MPLSPRVGVWPRVGVSGASHSASEAGDDNPLIVSTVTTWDLTIDPQLAVVLAPRIVFMSGLLLDIGIAGKQSWDDEAGSQQRAYRSSAYGVSAGLAVMF